MDAVVQPDRLLDARSLSCPLPVLRTSKEMTRLGPGEVLKVLATDRGASSDIPAWAEMTGHEVVSQGEEDGAVVIYIRKCA
jgi:tRNA 2-thiouridine synthesizing protein A